MDIKDIARSGIIGSLQEQITQDSHRITDLELEVECLHRDLKMLESFQQALTKVLMEKLGLILPDFEMMKQNYKVEQLNGDLSPLERLSITGFRLPPPE